MITFRCPKCKLELSFPCYMGKYIKYISCSNCRRKMIKLNKPTKRKLQKEKELNMLFQN